MKKRTVFIVAIGAIALLLVGLSAASAASSSVKAELPMPASVFASATVDGCDNNPGPFITLSGELSLGGINARLIFRNNAKGTHEREEETAVDVVLIPEGETIQFAKQPSAGGVGGNPWIFIQFFDSSGNALSEETLLGRCVQGLDPTQVDFSLLTAANAEVTTDSCTNHPGPVITLSGEMALEGINALLTFRNNARGTHEHEEEVQVEVIILPAGETISFAKQPPLDGVGGNPRISLQFLDGSGQPLGDEIFLGRCVQLSK